ncbi:GNAT family N-acetyltransferase [Natrialbaceae archaeon A-arb3/5]
MVDVHAVTDEQERADALDVRHDVFVEEQGVDEDLEYDEHEDEAVHFVAYDGNEAVGAARLREYEDDVGKIERVAVLEPRRGDGIGRELIRTVEERARTLGFGTLLLHSQTRADDFYRQLGYERYGETFEKAGISHVEMRKSLAN